MPTLSSKRQITLPKALCDRLNLKPGDSFSICEHKGEITLMKMIDGSGWGVLRHINAKDVCTDEESLLDAIENSEV